MVMPNEYPIYIAGKLKEKGEPVYAWLVGYAPAPIKGLPQKYLVYKVSKATLQVYESKHSYTLMTALEMAKEGEDFAMSKSKKTIGDLMNEAHVIACQQRSKSLSKAWGRMCEIRRAHERHEMIDI